MRQTAYGLLDGVEVGTQILLGRHAGKVDPELQLQFAHQREVVAELLLGVAEANRSLTLKRSSVTGTNGALCDCWLLSDSYQRSMPSAR
jgi:hypothetical protein